MGARPGARYFRVVVVWVLLVERAPGDLTVEVWRTKTLAEKARDVAIRDGFRTHFYRREFMEDHA